MKLLENIFVGFGQYGEEEGRRYDEGWERTFGEAARKAREEKSPEQRAREAADAGKRHAAKVASRTARMRIQEEKKLKEWDSEKKP